MPRPLSRPPRNDRLSATRVPFPETTPHHSSAAPPSASILLIDDDPAVLESLSRVLASEGWRVITAKTGEEGLERLQEQEPDLMITDLRMANVSGWDLLFHENLQRPRLPIFVITALPPDATGGADKFATEFFQKPLDLEHLLATVRQYLAPRAS